jgi:hypothetical protein
MFAPATVDPRPVWLLDVDGVLNATRPGWSAPPHTLDTYADGSWWRLRWAPALINRVRAMTRTVDVWWATTWCPHADSLEGIWRLPCLPRALTAEVATGSVDVVTRAKVAAAHAAVAAGRPLIWTDDMCVPILGPVRDDLVAAGALLIRPMSRRGLQPEEMDAIEEYAVKHTTT